ncbi:hypothetical protein FRC03_007616 [Tulasnella sp. 419]|nr:hypothetical protein FRC03_007616 [Tulasnella sp. 419]
MADFGMGIASGALIEVLKLINNYRKEVKINKEQARLLASEAEQIINHLESLVTQVQKDGLSSNDPAYVALKRFSDEFHMSLLKIADRMKDWAALHWFTRALPGTKSEMQNEISELKSQLTRHWTVFQDQLATYNIYLTAQVKIRMEKIDTSLKDAREEDTKNDAIFIRQLAQTLKLSQENAEIGRETAVNIGMIKQMSISTADAVNKLQTPATPASNEDPSMAEARMELIEALRSYEGEFPPFGIDSSELTMPFAGVPHYIGTNSIIHKGYRNGRLVAIKQLRIADPKELDTVYERIRHEAEIWSGLIHPNITRFLGCCRPKDELGYMVSVWAEHEDARKYLKKHQDANFLKLVSTISHAALS